LHERVVVDCKKEGKDNRVPLAIQNKKFSHRNIAKMTEKGIKF